MSEGIMLIAMIASVLQARASVSCALGEGDGICFFYILIL